MLGMGVHDYNPKAREQRTTHRVNAFYESLTLAKHVFLAEFQLVGLKRVDVSSRR